MMGMAPYSIVGLGEGMGGMAATLAWGIRFECAMSYGGRRLMLAASILSRLAGSKDCLRLADLAAVFWTRKEAAGALVGDMGGTSLAGDSALTRPGDSVVGVPLLEPQPHFCFLGMAAVTLPQPQPRAGG